MTLDLADGDRGLFRTTTPECFAIIEHGCFRNRLLRKYKALPFRVAEIRKLSQEAGYLSPAADYSVQTTSSSPASVTPFFTQRQELQELNEEVLDKAALLKSYSCNGDLGILVAQMKQLSKKPSERMSP